MLTLQIAGGIWLGVMLVAGTVWAGGEIADRIKKATRYGAPWWSAFYGAR